MEEKMTVTYAKLNNNQFVSMDVIARICGVLKCDAGDILEMIPENHSVEL